MRWIDVSMSLREGMIVWPGDDPFRFVASSRIAEGASCNTSAVTTPTHAGTHCDAPWHFEDGGKRLHEIDPEIYFGEAEVIHLPGVAVITATDLPARKLSRRVLFKTSNSDCQEEQPFNTQYVALDASAAQRLVDDGVRLAGVDYLSVAPYKQSGPTHHILLQNEVFVVEGLRLKAIPAGVCTFVVLPMPLHGADGAPCRAFAGLPDDYVAQAI
jgi:arylformamidase